MDYRTSASGLTGISICELGTGKSIYSGSHNRELEIVENRFVKVHEMLDSVPDLSELEADKLKIDPKNLQDAMAWKKQGFFVELAKQYTLTCNQGSWSTRESTY